ncbi:hypothetical protein BH23CHL4_BH23CHL4_26860 [soil metagenome]
MERGGGECIVRPYILKLDCGERKQPTQVSMNASSSMIVAFTGNAIMKVANLEQFSCLLTVPTGLSFRPERRNLLPQHSHQQCRNWRTIVNSSAYRSNRTPGPAARDLQSRAGSGKSVETDWTTPFRQPIFNGCA